jgi:hypothetical protein
MKTLDKKSKAKQSLLKNDYQQINNAIDDSQIETIQLSETLYLKDHESLLFQMYDLEEEDLFI